MISLVDFFASIDEWGDTAEVCPTHGIEYTMDHPCCECEDEFDSKIDVIFEEEAV